MTCDRAAELLAVKLRQVSVRVSPAQPVWVWDVQRNAERRAWLHGRSDGVCLLSWSDGGSERVGWQVARFVRPRAE